MKSSVIIWDLETVPDLAGFAAANDLTGKSDVEVREAIGDKFFKHNPLVARTHDLPGLVRSLPLSQLFLVTTICGVAAGALVLVAVRVTVHVLGIAPTQSLPIRDALIGSLSAMFALMVAFSAAGIWSDAVQARAAVQREANSIENIIAIAWSFPNEFRDQVHNENSALCPSRG